MKLKVSDNLFELNNTDITKINLLIKENFIAFENISSFVLNLFDKFNASSFAEVVRKACFFNIIDKNIDENYLNDVNTFARSQIKKRMLIRRFFIKQDWILKELNQQSILLPNEHKKLLDAKQKLTNKGHKNISKDDLIAELSLGFWIHLCTKRYKTALWHKQGFFRIVFADYPNFSEFDKLSKVFPVLQLMLKLRNRVFHHEIIINHPHGINNCYKDLRKLLNYISKDSLLYLDKICDFNKVITKQKTQ